MFLAGFAEAGRSGAGARELLLWLLLVCLASGCAKNPAPLSVKPLQFLDLDAERYFTLHNSLGRSAPERIPGLEKAPLGAMVVLLQPKPAYVSPYLCSVTHIAPGYVLTAAHCVQKFKAYPDQISFVFYNRSGNLESVRGLSVHILGTISERDLALVRIPETAGWDSWSNSLEEFQAQAGNSPKSAFTSIVWSLDPMERAASFDVALPIGMQVQPRTCSGSKQFPVLKWTGDEEAENLIRGAPINKDNFYYFDTCERPWEQGNSGALITWGNNKADALLPAAVASAIYFLPKTTSGNESLEFTGPSGLTYRIREGALNVPLFNVGGILAPGVLSLPMNL